MAATESVAGETARVVAAGAMLGASTPVMADYASLALCGFLGAMIKIGSTPAIRSSVPDAMWSLAIGVSAAVLFGWAGAHYLADWAGQTVDMLLPPLAGVLGLIGRDWPGVVRALWHWRTAAGPRTGGEA